MLCPSKTYVEANLQHDTIWRWDFGEVIQFGWHIRGRALMMGWRLTRGWRAKSLFQHVRIQGGQLFTTWKELNPDHAALDLRHWISMTGRNKCLWLVSHSFSQYFVKAVQMDQDRSNSPSQLCLLQGLSWRWHLWMCETHLTRWWAMSNFSFWTQVMRTML